MRILRQLPWLVRVAALAVAVQAVLTGAHVHDAGAKSTLEGRSLASVSLWHGLVDDGDHGNTGDPSHRDDHPSCAACWAQISAGHAMPSTGFASLGERAAAGPEHTPPETAVVSRQFVRAYLSRAPPRPVAGRPA